MQLLDRELNFSLMALSGAARKEGRQQQLRTCQSSEDLVFLCVHALMSSCGT